MPGNACCLATINGMVEHQLRTTCECTLWHKCLRNYVALSFSLPYPIKIVPVFDSMGGGSRRKNHRSLHNKFKEEPLYNSN